MVTAVQSVGWFEAWGLWWRGTSLQGMALWGFPMLVVGRTAKVVGFSGGVVAVIDIVGPARIRTWGRRARSSEPKIRRWSRLPVWYKLAGALTVASLLLTFAFARTGPLTAPDEVILNAISIFTFFLALVTSADFTIPLIGYLLEHPRWEPVVRWSGFMMVIVGFSFDLLAS